MTSLFIPGDILLPGAVDMSLWSVIACDQYTAQPDYWDSVGERVGDAPSALRLILPEAYLRTKDAAAETDRINRTMEDYLSGGLFETCEDSYIYLERELSAGGTRRGLLGLIDLEAYDYRANSVSPVHATEGTVESRLPPRVKIREAAGLELPHIVVFIDDPENMVLGDLSIGDALYDFALMDGGGRVRGARVCGEKARRVQAALERLASPGQLAKRYGKSPKHPVILAVGDGNHSLAAARFCWERLRETLTPEERKTHP
ncbi:MAG: DUF1015 domain-containing protein, partial [Oscillospiraceae bacterium]|nr:DUF1015 domain-containing protein [Oscillospiraceae bacterium]